MSDGGSGIAPMVGRRIAQARELRGYTQAEVAEELGMSVQSVSAWEHGRREPGLDALAQLAQVLGCAVGDFFPAAESEPMTDRPLIQRLASLERQFTALRRSHDGLTADVEPALAELRDEGLLSRPPVAA